ncbi:hypothetical protein Amet_4161 [Alkaliphilus metalliredigens QYMF]|uniref:Uncharacterized protein n=1 Tax=Alkaliphilus metalliredigens (strain QYMF) TaxID=293826 RepID=A6TVM4_ALKMQ|nr:hypothetical protein [Alkaliphilus metalliredigens]ABR50242.1 hypothetical protein Amet_4161 [Alkaliphilus metalliredigens QYMF]
MKLDKSKLIVLLCAFVSVVVTWYINHEMGYGAIVANGLVGVLAAIFLPGPLAGATYTASFVGMSSTVVLPSLLAAGIGGLVVGAVIVLTTEIYAGIGGKGGTTAALSGLITRTIMNILG